MSDIAKLLRDRPEGDLKTGERVYLSDKGWVVKGTDKDQPILIGEFDDHAGGFHQHLKDNGYSYDPVKGFTGPGLPEEGILIDGDMKADFVVAVAYAIVEEFGTATWSNGVTADVGSDPTTVTIDGATASRSAVDDITFDANAGVYAMVVDHGPRWADTGEASVKSFSNGNAATEQRWHGPRASLGVFGKGVVHITAAELIAKGYVGGQTMELELAGKTRVSKLGKSIYGPLTKGLKAEPTVIFSILGAQAEYHAVLPNFIANNIKGTLYVPWLKIGTLDYMTWAQVGEFHAAGWDIQLMTTGDMVEATSITDLNQRMTDLDTVGRLALSSRGLNPRADKVAYVFNEWGNDMDYEDHAPQAGSVVGNNVIEVDYIGSAAVGWRVTAPGLPDDTFITAIDSAAKTITLNNAPTIDPLTAGMIYSSWDNTSVASGYKFVDALKAKGIVTGIISENYHTYPGMGFGDDVMTLPSAFPRNSMAEEIAAIRTRGTTYNIRMGKTFSADERTWVLNWITEVATARDDVANPIEVLTMTEWYDKYKDRKLP